jgi:hypothetical protein
MGGAARQVARCSDQCHVAMAAPEPLLTHPVRIWTLSHAAISVGTERRTGSGGGRDVGLFQGAGQAGGGGP